MSGSHLCVGHVARPRGLTSLGHGLQVAGPKSAFLLRGGTFPLNPEVRTGHTAPLQSPALVFRVCRFGGPEGSPGGARIGNQKMTLEWF